MDIQNFSALFNTPARREAFLKLIKDNKTKHIFIQGLEGSSIALFFSNLLEHKQAHIIIANDLDEAGYLYNDLVQINGNDHILYFHLDTRGHQIRATRPPFRNTENRSSEPPVSKRRVPVDSHLSRSYRRKGCPGQYAFRTDPSHRQKIRSATSSHYPTN